MVGNIAQKTIVDLEDEIVDLSLKIWRCPEGPFKEFNASAWVADYLEGKGFAVEREAFGIKTAIKASWGNGSPVIALLGEYDALPNLSQTVSTHKESIPGQEYGQGCGHNLICAASVAAAVAVQSELKASGAPGTIVFYGCPAEELLLGKPLMARAGAFTELDAAYSYHPMYNNEVSMGNLMAANSVKFHFSGTTSHAATDPQNGRSAQDAVELMNVGVNYLREHVAGDVRMHYAITETGHVPNIVPDKACVWYFMRAKKRDTVDEVYKRITNIANGAALMTGTSVDVEFLGGCYETMHNSVLSRLAHEAMSEISQGEYTEEEIAFAKELNDIEPALTEKQREKAKAESQMEIQTNVPPISNEINYGSTDSGDVAHICPTSFFTTACYNVGAAGHSWEVVSCSGHSIGQKGMLFGAKVLATAIMRLMDSPQLLDEAKKEFEGQMAGAKYICPIPDDVTIASP